MSTEKMREEFSQWLLDVHGLESEWQLERNCFKDYPAHLAFQSWQASRAAIEVELPDYTSPFYGGDNFDECQYAADCEKAIESLGLRVKP